MSEVQITDVSGGSTVQVYYNSGTNRRGPFTLWTNTGGANSSISFINILQTIDGLDSGAFTYMGTSGALEFITQDGSHLIQAAVRTYSGNNSRTFPALADVETNTAATGRSLLVPNLSNDSDYRPSVVLFNPTANSVTVEVRIIGSKRQPDRLDLHADAGRLRDERGHDRGAGQHLQQRQHRDQGDLGERPGAGLGPDGQQRDQRPGGAPGGAAGSGLRQLAGQPADPDRGEPGSDGGWMSAVQITDMSGGSTVQVYYNSGTNRRGPFTLWTNAGGANSSISFINILQTIDGLDSGAFIYYGHERIAGVHHPGRQPSDPGGGAHLQRQLFADVPGLRRCCGQHGSVGAVHADPEHIATTAAYRPSVVLFNPTADSVTVEGRIIGSDGSQIGSTITRTLAGYEMNVVTTEVRANTYSNATIVIKVTSGTGTVLVSGQTANNISNDPAAHIAVQAQ